MRNRHFLFSLLVGIGLGVVFASFYAAAQPERAMSILAGGALTGIFISVAISLLERLLTARIDALPSPLRLFAKSIEFLVGGLGGWLVGMTVSSYLFGFGISLRTMTRGNWAIVTLVTGGITVAVGFAFYAYELLQQRLERTIEQLKQREWAEKELELARAIQTRLLPPTSIEGDGFRVEARNLPARFVAGDFYDVVPLEDGSVVIVVADVAGKGVGASLIMASVKAVLPFVAREGVRKAISMLNAKLVHELGRREFVALAYARFRPSDGSVELVNAGMPDPYVLSNGGVRVLAATGERLPLGLKPDAPYEPLAARIEIGERLLFLSDGIPEAPVNGEPLGYDRVEELLAHPGPFDLDDFLRRVREAVDEGLSDDWTALVVQRT